MIHIHYAKRFRRTPKGWLAARCPHCNTVRAFYCDYNTMAEEIWFVEVASHDVGEVITCDFCGSSFAFPKGQQLVVTREWSRNQPLQVLVDATNPALGRVPESGAPTPEQLNALLISIRGQSSAIKADAIPGVIIGGACGGALGLTAGLTLHAAGQRVAGIDAFCQGAMFLLCGVAVGALLGAAWWVRRKSRLTAAELLAEAIAKHRLDREKLRLAILNNPGISRHLLGVVDAHQATKGAQ